MIKQLSCLSYVSNRSCSEHWKEKILSGCMPETDNYWAFHRCNPWAAFKCSWHFSENCGIAGDVPLDVSSSSLSFSIYGTLKLLRFQVSCFPLSFLEMFSFVVKNMIILSLLDLYSKNVKSIHRNDMNLSFEDSVIHLL